jgi:hypothetical protein
MGSLVPALIPLTTSFMTTGISGTQDLFLMALIVFLAESKSPTVSCLPGST